MVPAVDGGYDTVRVGSPDEWFGIVIVLFKEAFDGGLEINDRMEDATLEPPLGELGEEALDRIEP